MECLEMERPDRPGSPVDGQVGPGAAGGPAHDASPGEHDPATAPPPGPVGTAGAAASDPWEPAATLPDARPAPKEARGVAGARAEDLCRLVVAVVVALCFERRGGAFTVREVWDRVPDPKPAYDRLNAVGDVLGQGGGRHGLKLWRGAGGVIACRQNATLALRRMAPEAVRELARRLGYETPRTFWAAVDSLPDAPEPATL